MAEADYAAVSAPPVRRHQASAAPFRLFVIGLTAFLTVVDLFATQAILPSLAKAYQVTPAAMGFAVNASTMGMATAGLVVAWLSRRIDRRQGVLFSLVLLARGRLSDSLRRLRSPGCRCSCGRALSQCSWG
jgi:MFS transporter, YNFM family, putative membrane transport protein